MYKGLCNMYSCFWVHVHVGITHSVFCKERLGPLSPMEEEVEEELVEVSLCHWDIIMAMFCLGCVVQIIILIHGMCTLGTPVPIFVLV